MCVCVCAPFHVYYGFVWCLGRGRRSRRWPLQLVLLLTLASIYKCLLMMLKFEFVETTIPAFDFGS